MRPIRRLLGRGGWTGLFAAAAFAAPAAADVKVECEIAGEIKARDKANPGLGIRLVGGEGKFTFQSTLVTCKGDTTKDGVPETDVITVTATGWYVNEVCGTGKALGTITSVGDAEWKLEMALTGRKFGIDIRAGTGIFKWHDPWVKPGFPLDKEDPVSQDKQNSAGDKNYTEAGVLQLIASTEKNELPDVGAGECTKGVTVAGTVTAHFGR